MDNVVADQRVETEEYVIRDFEPRDRERFLSLYESVWNVTKTREWFDWRFVQNPYRKGVDMIVAEHDGRLVGAEPLLPFRMRAAGHEALAFQPVDWIVHPQYRRQGLFTRMTTYLLERYSNRGAFLFNFPTDELIPGLAKFDWTVVGTVPECHRVHRPSVLLAAAAREGKVHTTVASMAKATDPIVRRYLDVRDRFLGQFPSITIERFASVPTAQLVEVYRTGVPDRIHVSRDEQYVRWRFSNPDWEPTTYVASTNGDPVAAIVVTTEVINDVNRTCLLDVQPMWPGPTAATALEALVGEIATDHRRTDVLKAVGMGRSREVLRRCGFRPGESFPSSTISVPTTLAVRPLRDGPRDDNLDPTFGGFDPTDIDDWMLSLCDQDIE